jgi:hypothetical protein
VLLVVAAAARPTEDLVVAAGVLQRAGGRIGFTHPLLESAELLELARKLTPPEDGAGLLGRTVQAAEYHFDAGDATRATALLEESIATAHPGRDSVRILLNQPRSAGSICPASKGAASRLCRRQRRTPGSEPRPMSTWPG